VDFNRRVRIIGIGRAENQNIKTNREGGVIQSGNAMGSLARIAAQRMNSTAIIFSRRPIFPNIGTNYGMA
jgi:hypothetical protein